MNSRISIMSSKKKGSKTKKVLLFIAGILILLVTISLILADYYIEGEVKKQFDQQFNNNPESIYSIEVEDVGIRIFGGAVYFENLNITPKDFATDSLDKGRVKSLIHLKIESFDLKGMKVIKFLKQKTLDIRKISVNGADIKYLIKPIKKITEKKESQDFTNIFSDAFKGATISEIEILNTDIKFVNNDQPEDPWFAIDSLSITLSNIVFDDSTITQELPFSFSDLSINTKHFDIKSLQYYDVTTDEIILNLKDSSLVIDGFKFLPILSKAEYNKQIPYEADLYLFKTEKIKLNGFDIKDIIAHRRIILSSIEIHTLFADIYRDKTIADPPYIEKPLFASLIRKIPIKTTVDSLLIYDSKLIYEEKQKLSEFPGNVNFDRLNIRAYNITNDSRRLEKNKYLSINVDARLMSEGNMKVWIKANLLSQSDEFKVTGLLGSIQGIAFNSMTKNLLLAEIQMGNVHSAWFSYTANNDESIGKLKIDYENLKMVAWKPDKQKEAKFLTFIGNNLIRKNNLPEDANYRTGVISFKRYKERGIPNFLWKSVQSGIISIIAPIAENKKQREVSRQMKKDQRKDKKNKKK